MADLITVKSTLEPGRVAFFEQDERHPNGEVFINDTEPHQVARTHFVIQRLRNGILEEVEGATVEAQDTAPAEPWAGYDEQTVDEITERLLTASPATVDAVLAYERARKARKGVLDAVGE